MNELYFERNLIHGTQAEKVVHLSKITSLGASSNFLEGTITETHLKNLPHLVYLDLSYNSLALEIDSNWSPTFQLDVISLASCKLGPSFPEWLQAQKNFSVLDISNAGIKDSVPFWFWDYLTPNLRYLNLSSNHIHGTVPDLMSGNKPMIDLSSNSLSGKLPFFPPDTLSLILYENMFSGPISSLCNLTILNHLDISNNQLSGELPSCWMTLNNLAILNLEDNKFTGGVPSSMGSLEYITMLSIRGNRLSGGLPFSLNNCTSLRLLDLGENKLSGRIPEWIGKSFSELVVLSLHANGFYGNMPTSFCNLAKIQIFDLSSNNISGKIPKCLNNVTGMTDRRQSPDATIEYNAVGLVRTRLNYRIKYVFQALLQWKGRLSEYRNTLGLVIILDLSSNTFSGEIPVEVTSLLALVALNISRNNLTGKIPQNIGQLRWLDFLDVSRNDLVGGIPISLSQLSNLGALDLSNNFSSGRIPSSTQLQSFDASSYTGNPALCGLPLPNACPADEPQTGHGGGHDDDVMGDQESDSKLITSGFYVSLLVGFVVGFWGIWVTLVLKDSWRYAYFEFLNKVGDWVCLKIHINLARFHLQS